MKSHAWIILVAAAAGLATGALWNVGPGVDATTAIGGTTSANRSSEMRLPAASTPGEVALGAALAELRAESPSLAGYARLGAALKELNSEQVARLLEQLESSDWRILDDRLPWLFSWWMKRDPAAASAWIRPRLAALAQDGPAGFTSTESRRALVVRAWAKGEPEAALAYARQHPRSGLATMILNEVLGAWKSRALTERLALVREFPAGTARTKALFDLHREWAGREPAEALASLRGLEAGPERDDVVGDVFRKWADRDPAAAREQYRALGLNDPRLLIQIFSRNVKKDVAQTIAWMEELDPVQMDRCAPGVVAAWADRDPVAALEWARLKGVSLSGRYESIDRVFHNGLGRSSSSGGDYYSPLTNALKKDAEATMAWLRGLPAGAERDRLMELAIGAGEDRGPALTLFATLPPNAQERSASRMTNFFREDPNAGFAWAASLPPGPVRTRAFEGIGGLTENLFDLPPGPDRDALLCGSLHRSGVVPPPAQRLEVLLQISNPALRRDMVDECMEYYFNLRSFEDDARKALEAAAIPEDWKQRWRRAQSR